MFVGDETKSFCYFQSEELLYEQGKFVNFKTQETKETGVKWLRNTLEQARFGTFFFIKLFVDVIDDKLIKCLRGNSYECVENVRTVRRPTKDENENFVRKYGQCVFSFMKDFQCQEVKFQSTNDVH